MMELPRERPPEYEHNFHHPDSLRLPAVPQHHLPQLSKAHDITLPALSTVLSSPELQQQTLSQRAVPTKPVHVAFNASGQFDNTEFAVPGLRKSLESTTTTPPSDRHSLRSYHRHQRSTSVLSMDDPDVRIAAEALSGLGNPSLTHSSPANTVTSNPYEVKSPGVALSASDPDPEPLLELLAQAHPWVGGAVNGSLSAYSTTKNYSPRVVQYGANLIERNIGHPVVSTVSSVGRMTGVESGLRRYLDRRRPSDIEAGALEPRPVFQDDMEIDVVRETRPNRFEMRRESSDSRFETLPAYRSSKPPSYRENASPSSAHRSRDPAAKSSSISSQLFIMTSGLGVALSETSRQSLRYCLLGLGQATEHIRTVTDALKLVLEQYDQAREHWHRSRGSSLEKGERPQTPEHDHAARRLAEIIKKHSDDIWHTLKNIVNYVSTTAGGALPENARHFVRTQLLSLPQRWRVVHETQPGENNTSAGAHRMIAFATEGLDMMSQVSHVCKATLDSADMWLQRVGSRRAHTYASEKTTNQLPPMAEDEIMHGMNEA